MKNEKQCPSCGDSFPPEYFDGESCRFCVKRKRFSDFARSCGLACYPDPDGERYVYHLDGDCAGKKSECIHLIDDLWNALVKAKGGPQTLMVDPR